MSSKVGNAAYSITLNLNVWAEHLPDERLETAQLDDEKLVVGCCYRLRRQSGA